ncbi:TetR/AcrR family transcriptional regulator [Methylorubrum populi]|uniref:Transcriptional regulator AcrR family n=1 Tax=Methylorubrum populi TaxID=223967 RepID=A0A833IZZ2_9HYPH|nr:TetR/AcrR family transcriptional regulator [Methylorubrum populi]KAB7781942.1 Transcriptional regulator AcrR family [Methylorubrum populi]
MPLTRKETQRQTRDRLIAAAHASIVEEGVAAMSIRNICGAAGHSQGAFYSNFASKDDLLVEIMQAHIHDEVAMLRDLVRRAEGANIEETLGILAARLAELAAEPQWSLLSIELQLHARRDPAFAERHREGKASCYRMFGELVADLTQRFGLRPALPPHQTGIGLYALWMGLAVQGDIEGAISRERMLVGFFRAMAGLNALEPDEVMP